MSTWPRLVFCFLVLPFLPLVALLLAPAGPIRIFQDRIALGVFAAVLAAASSGYLALRSRRTPLVCAMYTLTTGVLTIVPVFVFIYAVLWINCSDQSWGGC